MPKEKEQPTLQELENAVFWEARMRANRTWNAGRRLGTFAMHQGPAKENQRYYDSVIERAVAAGMITLDAFRERVREKHALPTLT